MASAGSPRREQSRFVDQIGEVGAGKTWRECSHLVGIDVGCNLHLLHVNLQDLRATLLVGPVHQHLTVEPAGPQQRGVENFRPVRGRENDEP
jgi:hypothetical protein